MHNGARYLFPVGVNEGTFPDPRADLIRPAVVDPGARHGVSGDIGEGLHHLGVLALLAPRHVEVDVAQVVFQRQELVEVLDLLLKLIADETLVPLSLLLLLHQIHDHNRRSILLQEMVEVFARRAPERVLRETNNKSQGAKFSQPLL